MPSTASPSRIDSASPPRDGRPPSTPYPASRRQGTRCHGTNRHSSSDGCLRLTPPDEVGASPRRQMRCRDPWSRPFADGGCGFEHRGNNRRISRAPADVTRKHLADLLLVRCRRVAQKMRHRAQYAGRAEAALQGVMLGEGTLHLVERAWFGEPLHGDDVGTVHLTGILGAAAHRSPIDQNRTGTAYAMLATDVNPKGLQLMTQKIAQQHARLGLARSALPIQRQLDREAFTGCPIKRCHCRRSLRCRAISSEALTARSTSTFVSAIR